MSFFEKVPLVPPDPIVELSVAFRKDPRKNKIDLGVGFYKTEDAQVPMLDSVKDAESFLLDSEKSKEYLPIDGDRHYLETMGAMVFGKEMWTKEKERIAAFQTVGGTGALKIGGSFLKKEAENSIWLSTPTWANHKGVFSNCGLKVENYPYYDAKNHRVDFENLTACLEKVAQGAIVVMQASCHNPTGSDLTLEQWEAVCALIKTKRLITFFDFAYQGFGRGIDEDAEAIRHFMKNGLEILIAVSNAKNLALYAERVGCLFIVTESAKITERVISRVKQEIRGNYSSPPMHGAKVAAHIFATPALRQKWEKELKEMRDRVNALRLELSDHLVAKSKNIDFSHLKKGRGMFGYIGLTVAQVDRLNKEYAIYMPKDGRMNICGLNQSNINDVVDAIIAVTHVRERLFDE